MNIKKIKAFLRPFLKAIGFFELKNLCCRFKRYLAFKDDFLQFSSLSSDNRFQINWNDRYPCLDDKTTTTGFDRHYLYHPAWAARIVAEVKPEKHIDISSTLNFSSMLSAFLPVEFYDFRPANVQLSNFESKAADILYLPFADNSIESLSCMHVVEHIGLGRYGDPLDPDGDLKAMAELTRVVAINGNLLFVVPVGRPRIQFNAHRVFSYEQIITSFSGLDLVQFALISEDADGGGLILNASAVDVANQNYGCGCFWFRKVGN